MTAMHNPFAKPRSSDLDFLRIIAAIAVVVIHCAAILVLERDVNDTTWMVGNIIDSFMRWCVPVFVMISGALLIKEKVFKERAAFIKKRLSRVAIPLIAWPFIYAIFSAFVLAIPFNGERLWFGIVAGDPAPGHLYFLFLIAGLYVATPLISLFVANVTRTQLWRVTIGIMVATVLWHAAEYFILRGGAPLNFLTQGLPYVGYYLLGYLLWTAKVTPRVVRIMSVAFVAASLAIMLGTYVLVKNFGIYVGYYFYAFPSVFVMAAAPAAFVCLRAFYAWAIERFKKPLRNKIEASLPKIAALTFGVYLVHLLFVKTIAQYLPLHGATVKGFLFLTATSLIGSFVATWLLVKIPGVRRLVA